MTEELMFHAVFVVDCLLSCFSDKFLLIWCIVKNSHEKIHLSCVFAFGLLLHRYSGRKTKSFVYWTGRALIFHSPPSRRMCHVFYIDTGFFISCRKWWGSFRGSMGKLRLFVSRFFSLLSGVQIAYLAIIGTQLFMILLSIVLLIGIHKVSTFRVYYPDRPNFRRTKRRVIQLKRHLCNFAEAISRDIFGRVVMREV